MPDLVPVDHDPFQYTPVDHDPFADVPGIGIVPTNVNPLVAAAAGGAAHSLADVALAPGNVARGQQPQTLGQWSDMDEAIRQANMRGESVWGPQMGLSMMGAGPPLASTGLRAGETALGIVPVDVGKSLGITHGLPDTDAFRTAVKNTTGARIEDNALVMPVTRNQRPEQELEESVRGGVFYLPQGSKDARFYSGTGHNFGYGGSDTIAGETAVKNPLFVKGATGGQAPKAAYDSLLGKGSYDTMRTDALRSSGAYYLSQDDKVELARQFLEKHAPELEGSAWQIVSNSTKGNQLPYALQEAAVASAVRKAGHDSVLGYGVSRKTKEPFISELFDVRESHYPSTAGDYQTWPQFVPVDHDPFK